MPTNPRNIDTDQGIPDKAGQATPAANSGTHDLNRIEAERATKDNKQAGREGRAKGEGAGDR